MRPKILYLVTEDWFFWSHRLPIARAALQSGYEVIVATRVGNYAQRIHEEGFRLVPLHLIRESYSPVNELRAILQLRQIYSCERPDIVHHVALKPILYGSIAALGRGQLHVINAFTGLGYLVGSFSLKAKLLRLPILKALTFLLNRRNHRVLVQNQDDKQLLATKCKTPLSKIVVIRGSGVDVDCFGLSPEPAGEPLVLLASRMLWIKGIRQFVEAAKLLHSKGVTARFVLVGDTDPNSPSCIPRQQLIDWHSSGEVEWWGHQQDMSRIFKQANLVCLPSHGGEGVPKVLIEAAASGRAIVTTDVPGCREVVRHGVNGLLVPPRNTAALVEAIERLITNSPRRLQMAARGREIVTSEFTQEHVVQQTLSLYGELLGCRAPAVSELDSSNEC
jgi:glycosyltransferase involved in cell wall biosynthesis